MLFSEMPEIIGMLFASTPPVRAIAMLANHASFLAAGIWLVTSLP